MIEGYQYFIIPFKDAPKDAPKDPTVWFASWSTQPPTLEPGMSDPVVIGATKGQLPAGATPLGTSSKDPPPCPPPLAKVDTSDYQQLFNTWLELGRDT